MSLSRVLIQRYTINQSAFYWGYSIGQIPASRFVQKYGGKWIFGFSILIPSLLTMLVPVAARSSLAVTYFLRAVIGFFESATFPAIFYYYPIWVPLEEKTFMIPAIVSGMYIGEIIGFSLSGMLVESDTSIAGWYFGGWQSVFYVFGLLGVVWFPYWALYAYDTPEKHPYITQEELRYINSGKDFTALKDVEQDSKTVPLLFDVETVLGMSGSGSGSGDDAENPIHISQSDLHARPRSRATSAADNSESLFGGNRHPSAERKRNISIISEEGREEASARIPWGAFFTNKVSLTLFANSWVLVSSLIYVTHILVLFWSFDRDGLVSLY